MVTEVRSNLSREFAGQAVNPLAGIDFGAIFAQASARSIKLAGQHMARIVKGYAEEAKSPGQFARMNQSLAEQMRASVLVAYQNNVLAHSIGPYRQGQGRYSEALLEALKSPTMATGTATGIGFIDEELLDATAKHWKRLNFGAGPAEGSLSRPRSRIQFGSNQGFTLGLFDQPRPNFNVPELPARRGYFLSNGQFHIGRPRSGSVVAVSGRPSKHGIAAKRFLDAGLVTLAQRFAPLYKEHFQDASRLAASRGRRVTLR